MAELCNKHKMNETERALIKYKIPKDNVYFSDAIKIIDALSIKYRISPERVLKTIKENHGENRNPLKEIPWRIEAQKKRITEEKEHNAQRNDKIQEYENKIKLNKTIPKKTNKNACDKIGEKVNEKIIVPFIVKYYESKIFYLQHQIKSSIDLINDLEKNEIPRLERIIDMMSDVQDIANMKRWRGIDNAREALSLILKYIPPATEPGGS